MNTVAAVRSGEREPSQRAPLRLCSEPRELDRIDGLWWPQSRNLQVELADLVDNFPDAVGHISRVVYSPPDWDERARRVPVRRGYIKAGCFPGDDTHVIRLSMSDRRILVYLVVPSTPTAAQRTAMLRATGAIGRRWIAEDPTGPEAVDDVDHWSDDGGAWAV